MQMAFGGWGDVLFITIQLKGVCMVGEIVIEVSRLNLTVTKSYKPILWMSRMLYIDIVSTQRLESRPRISSNDRESEKPNDEAILLSIEPSDQRGQRYCYAAKSVGFSAEEWAARMLRPLDAAWSIGNEAYGRPISIETR